MYRASESRAHVRGERPWRGARHLGLAKTLVAEMPRAKVRSGRPPSAPARTGWTPRAALSSPGSETNEAVGLHRRSPDAGLTAPLR